MNRILWSPRGIQQYEEVRDQVTGRKDASIGENRPEFGEIEVVLRLTESVP